MVDLRSTLLFRKLAAISLIAYGCFLVCSSLWFKVDSPEDLLASRFWDLFVGFIFAVGFLVGKWKLIAHKREAAPWVYALIIWGSASTPLLCLHEVVTKMRWRVPPSLLTRNRLRIVESAIKAYIKDCGHPPSDQQGLSTLLDNAGEKGWAGPYASKEELIDGWGNRLQYSFENGQFRIWSVGPDAEDGTYDDILLPAN